MLKTFHKDNNFVMLDLEYEWMGVGTFVKTEFFQSKIFNITINNVSTGVDTFK
jgi:hypothetical protein